MKSSLLNNSPYLCEICEINDRGKVYFSGNLNTVYLDKLKDKLFNTDKVKNYNIAIDNIKSKGRNNIFIIISIYFNLNFSKSEKYKKWQNDAPGWNLDYTHNNKRHNFFMKWCEDYLLDS